MITKWFIHINKNKSRGLVKYFNGHSSYGRGLDFTKQTALALSSCTEKDALARIEVWKSELIKTIKEQKKLQADFLTTQKNWLTATDEERIAFCYNNGVRINDPKKTGGYNSYNRHIYFSQPSVTSYAPDQLQAVKDASIGQLSLDKYDKNVDRLKEIQAKVDRLVVCEKDLEIKFMDRERREISWSIRDENDTSNQYCNCCGGAIPGIPQLRIAGRSWKETCYICSICMSKLSQEAEIQAGKVDQDILDHYNTDRFLRSLS
jgi:hypothetical protein